MMNDIMRDAYRIACSKYATGMHRIDKDHFVILYKLLQIRDSAEKENLFPSVVAFLKRHFAYEEEIMELVSYPLIDLHKSVHKEYLLRFEAAVTIGSGFDLNDLITDTLNHFVWHDKLLVQYLNENNLIDVVQGIAPRRISSLEQPQEILQAHEKSSIQS